MRINVAHVKELQDALRVQLEARRRNPSPLQYDQDCWATIKAEDVPANFDELRDINICKTNCCLAGTAVTLIENFNKFKFEKLAHSGMMYAFAYLDKRGKRHDIAKCAREWLGISVDQAEVLFNSSDDWPEPYATRYADAGEDSADRIQVAIEFLDDVIASNGDVLIVEPDDDEDYGGNY